MWKFCSLLRLLLLCSALALVAARGSTNRTAIWQTLSGDAPLVIARGGFSGLFPDSSYTAYALSLTVSLPNVILWCDLQLTKDGVGICFPDVRLDNGSDIFSFFKNSKTEHLVNGVPMQGWFTMDFNFKDLAPVNLRQGVYSRTNRFDATPAQILTVQDVASLLRPPGFWLNVQHDAFYSQHNLSMRSFVISATRTVIFDYISSPEINFLRSVISRLPRSTKLVFRFLGHDEFEPSTNQTYGSLLNNLTFIKTFASGILVPKYYIWPVDSNLYLQPQTSVVLDAHKEGLNVFASDFANDATFAYNYSYDPVAEYLSFVDNGVFSVDGVLSDFPITPSSAIDCFSHMGKNEKVQVSFSIFSSEGASGDFPGCTDLAYAKAIADGVDILDCPVQMTKDGVPFCLGSINLIDRTTVAQSPFSNRASSIPQLSKTDGIFTFNLTWSEIQSLSPAISNPWANYTLYRNPKFKNAGKFVSLSDFLTLANNATSVSGVLISIENAAYLAANQGLGITDAVFSALSEAGYDNRTSKKVMIESTDSPVLLNFEKRSNYELVYKVKEDISGVLNSTISEIKKFATSVVITKKSVFPSDDAFLLGATDIVQKLQAFNLSVYVEIFSNEFVSQAWDFFSDAYVEINSYIFGSGINGVVTDFPATAAKFRRNRCLGSKETPLYMSPVQPGSLAKLIAPQLLPPAEAPNPVLSDSDVVEPPLPPVASIPPPADTSRGPTAAPTSRQAAIVANIFMSSVAVFLATVILS